MKTAIVALIFLLSLPCIAIGDDSLKSVRCKAGLINVGANKLEVIKKCGEPVNKDILETGSKQTKRDYAVIEEWSYNFGPMDFLYTFRLEGSTLVDIRRGDRGF
jgi:hypothetical protein